MSQKPEARESMGSRASPMVREWLGLGLVLGLTVTLLLPFLDKAFHIDDVYFIEVAQNILRDPLRPFAGAVALEDIDYRVFASAGRAPETFASMSHPPLVPYVIALVAWLTGGFSECWLHLAFSLFALLAAWAGYVLARRFTAAPLAAGLLIVASPIFVLSAQSLMTDMPTLAFSLGALALLVRGLDRDRWGFILAAGVLAGLAIVTRYAAVMIVPLLLLYGLARGRLWRSLLALLGLAVVCGLWAWQNLAVHGELHLLASARHYRLFYQGQSFDWPGVIKKTVADLSALGGTAFVAAGLLALGVSWRRWGAFVSGAACAAAVFVVRPRGIERLETYSWIEIAAVAACAGLGVLLLAEAVLPGQGSPPPGAGRRVVIGDHAFLVVWLLVALLGAFLVLPFGTARYMLPVWPPLVLLLVRRLEVAFPGERMRHGVLAVAFAQLVAVGLLLGLADAELAGRYRAAAALARSSQPGRTLWFVGEWGFRYYMTTVGGRYLRSDDQSPAVGDFILRPFIAGMHELPAGVRARSVRIQEVTLAGRWPIRLMSFEAKAGYYSHHWGFLPFAPSRTPLERIDVFEVRAPAADELPVPP